MVNGEKIEAEAVLLPGDRLQIGDSTILFEPPAPVSLSDLTLGEVHRFPIEELLPTTGAEGALLSAGLALLSATSEAMLLRRAAHELARALNADHAAALLGSSEGLITASVAGATSTEVPRELARPALENKITSRSGGTVCAPLAASGGGSFGILYAARSEPFTVADQSLAAALGRLTGQAFAALRARARAEPDPAHAAMVGSSRPHRKLVEQARRAAAVTTPVFLHGEAGSGRALTARYIHARSARALGPLVIVDGQQGVVSLEEDLFGRPSGPGVPPLPSALMRADGGTLVLQQVELFPRPLALRLATLLQRKQAPAPEGGEEWVDLRLIVTAGASAQVLASRGDLEPELAQAFKGLEIELLPLRERRADVPSLFEVFAQRVTKPLRKEPPSLTPDARRLLVDYAWPGNIRELKLVSERLAGLYAGAEVNALRLPPEVQEGTAGKGQSLEDLIRRLERDAISEALREAKGKKIKAASLLGISRPTLDKKIEDYQLVVEKVRKS